MSDPQIELRARDLLGRMSLEERLAMMDGDLPLWRGLDDLLRRDCYHKRPFSAGRNERLGIEGVRFIDGPRGIVLEGGATTFPVSMARGATFDPELEERVGDAIGKELRSHGGNLYGGVCVNLLRHPAWGRAQETYGEDPLHVGAMGAALVARRTAQRDGVREAPGRQLDGEHALRRRRPPRRAHPPRAVPAAVPRTASTLAWPRS